MTATEVSETGKPPVEPATPARPPAAIPERFVAYVFDDVHVKGGDLLRVRLAAQKHLEEHLDPAMRAGIFTTSGRVTLDFTGDLDRIRETLLRITPQVSDVPAQEECPAMNLYWADLIINKQDQQATDVAIDDVAACLNLSGPDAAEIARPIARALAITMIGKEERQGRLPISVLKDVVRRLSATPGSRSIVLTSSGFFVDQDMRQEEMDVMDRAIRSNVTINSLDARALYAIIPGGDASTPVTRTFSQQSINFHQRLEIQNALLETDVMAEFANATGGRFFHNDNGLSEGFTQLEAQPEYVYVLGFSPQNLKLDGRFHDLKISVRNGKGLDIQTRRGYYAPNHLADDAEQSKEEIQEAVFSRDQVQDIPVDLNLQFFKLDDATARLTVIAKVSLNGLHFRTLEDRHNNTLTLVSAVFDRNGNFVTGVQRVIEMHLRDQTLDALSSQGITVRSTHQLASGSYLVRVVVRDSEGQTMAARNGAVEIP